MDPKLYIFDLDGTLYRGEQPVSFAIETLAELRSQGFQVRFLTNNSSCTRAQITEKLQRLGFEASLEEVFTSGMGAGNQLRTQGIEKAFVVGEDGLIETLAEYGIQSIDEGPLAVVVGICRNFDYSWMNKALQHLIVGVKFFATNTDATYPIENGRVQPGAGAIVASIKACSQFEPIVIGKPEPYLIKWILDEAGVNPEEALVVGDRMETDIEAGKRAGCATLLVGTGVTQSPPIGQWFATDLRSILLDR